MKIYVFAFLLSIVSLGCSKPDIDQRLALRETKTDIQAQAPQKSRNMIRNKTPDKKGEKGVLIRAEVLLKPFINRRGKPNGHSDFYVRRSIQDYFIKFCESAVTQENMEDAIKEHGTTLSLEVEIKQGDWDRCGVENVQSRVGAYMIIHQIL